MKRGRGAFYCRGRPVKHLAGGIGLPLLILAHGCVCVPPAGEYFDRGDPFNTINAFTYAIDTKQWQYAYDCLTEKSKKLYTYTKFKFAMVFNREVPQLEIPIRDLILTAQRNRYRAHQTGHREATMKLWCELPNGDLLIPFIYLELESESQAKAAGREEPDWLIDLERTFQGLQGPDPSAY